MSDYHCKECEHADKNRVRFIYTCPHCAFNLGHASYCPITRGEVR